MSMLNWADAVEEEEMMNSQSESEESSTDDEVIPATEESLVAMLTKIILSEKFMDRHCSCSVERVVEKIERKARGLLENVLGSKKSPALVVFMEKNENFVVIETNTHLRCGRVEKIVRVAMQGTDYQRGDHSLQLYEEERSSHIVKSLETAVALTGQLVVDDFIEQYKNSTLALDIYYSLPKRGDLVRLLKQRRGSFYVSNPTKNQVVITSKKTQVTRQNRLEQKWNAQPRRQDNFHNTYYHC
eukprot:NODE_5602_length_992_cov_207.109321_g5026_i0.p1 GENE.NODE_5602_length_992_cov_207.109321_g5026_i0~~NODE_5602_length_992_cov_207.109321_g5026_i0.p1  ORF type:complete len:264 (-),score=26.97 NODE_5602_length_992_cov_207.109321_g5026_i0:201-929(-)